MNWESMGYGAGAGFVASLMAFFGWNRRLNKIEDFKQDKTVCEVIHKGTEQRLERIEGKLDDLNDYLRNNH